LGDDFRGAPVTSTITSSASQPPPSFVCPVSFRRRVGAPGDLCSRTRSPTRTGVPNAFRCADRVRSRPLNGAPPPPRAHDRRTPAPWSCPNEPVEQGVVASWGPPTGPTNYTNDHEPLQLFCLGDRGFFPANRPEPRFVAGSSLTKARAPSFVAAPAPGGPGSRIFLRPNPMPAAAGKHSRSFPPAVGGLPPGPRGSDAAVALSTAGFWSRSPVPVR